VFPVRSCGRENTFRLEFCLHKGVHFESLFFFFNRVIYPFLSADYLKRMVPPSMPAMIHTRNVCSTAGVRVSATATLSAVGSLVAYRATLH
jgi:hypothetical protein